MAHPLTTFLTPITTYGLPGFPETLNSVTEARAIIEATRLPAIRSGYAWLQAYNRLTEALAARTLAQIESAAAALDTAIRDEYRDRATSGFQAVAA